MNTLKFDLIVIGGGSGTKLVKSVADLGKKVAVIEKESMGGTCLNRGCIPSKMLIYPSELLHEANRLNQFEVKNPVPFPGIQLENLVGRIDSVIDAEARSIPPAYEKHEHITYFNHHAAFVSDRILKVGDVYLTAPRIVIAVGSVPRVPDISGLKSTPYMTSREFLKNKRLPDTLVVLGGGFIACEMANAYAAFGVDVTVLTRGQFLQRIDTDIKAEFLKGKDSHLTIMEQVQVMKVDYHNEMFTVTATIHQQEVAFKANALLVATGIVPNTESLGLSHTSIAVSESGHVQVDAHMQTSVQGVYAIGDVAGNFFFRHSANFEGEYLFDHLFKNEVSPIQYPPMPSAIFTHPQIASVGKSEHDLIREHTPYIKGSNAYSASAMGMARQSSYGLVKLLFHAETKVLLGAHIVGDEAATLIHTLMAFMHMKATLSDVLGMIYIHPALPEIVRNAARKAIAVQF